MNSKVKTGASGKRNITIAVDIPRWMFVLAEMWDIVWKHTH